MNTVSFLSFWVTNSLFFYLSFLVWPGGIVLGNNIRSPIVASMLSGFLLTIVTALVPYFLTTTKLKTKKGFKLATIYFVFNVVGIWLIARAATITGFGISAFWVALVLGFLVNLLQWGIFRVAFKPK